MSRLLLSLFCKILYGSSQFSQTETSLEQVKRIEALKPRKSKHHFYLALYNPHSQTVECLVVMLLQPESWSLRTVGFFARSVRCSCPIFTGHPELHEDVMISAHAKGWPYPRAAPSQTLPSLCFHTTYYTRLLTTRWGIPATTKGT